MTATNPLNTPVAFLIFNRPEVTARVFEQIRKVRPAMLLVVADGPRPNHPGDEEKCRMARAVVEQVDWPCQVQKQYAAANMGCRNRVSSGLDWVFSLAPEAIILEDDCLPHPSFFPFCASLLECYRDDPRVMHISGDNFYSPAAAYASSYRFSRYAHVWGWATWRRAWRLYDVQLRAWQARERPSYLLNRFPRRNEQVYWKRIWDSVAAGKAGTWDHQWGFACLANGGKCVVPNVNLVSNIGFGSEATHTAGASSVACLPAYEMPFPLKHPESFAADEAADEQVRKLFFVWPGFRARMQSRGRRLKVRLSQVLRG